MSKAGTVKHMAERPQDTYSPTFERHKGLHISVEVLVVLVLITTVSVTFWGLWKQQHVKNEGTSLQNQLEYVATRAYDAKALYKAENVTKTAKQADNTRVPLANGMAALTPKQDPGATAKTKALTATNGVLVYKLSNKGHTIALASVTSGGICVTVKATDGMIIERDQITTNPCPPR